MSWLDRLNPFRRAATIPAATLATLGGGLPSRAPVPVMEVRSAADVARANPDPQWTYSFNKGAAPDAALNASVWVYACAREIARGARSIPLKVYKGAAQAPPTDPLVQLLKQPVRGWTQARWVEANAYHLTLTGRSLIRKYRARALGRSLLHPGQGLPGELFPFTLLDFKVEVDKDDQRRPIESYEPRKGDTTTVLPRDMVDVMYVRPGKPDEGYAPTEAAQREISTDRQASAWQQVALQNRGVPDGLIVAKSSISEAQEALLEEHIRERWIGMRNAHAPLVMGDELQWIDLAKTAVEMELVPGRLFTKDAICAAFGVPSVIFAAASSTYANYEVARAILGGHTVAPLVRDIADALNIHVAPEFGPDYEVVPDLEASDAHLPQLRARWEAASKALASGVPMSQVSETFRLGVQPYLGWDVPLVPSSLIPLSALTGGEDLDPLDPPADGGAS